MIWEVEGGEQLFFDNHETVRFRIEEEEWYDQAPIGPKKDGVVQERKSPYKLVASMEDSGMGPCLWWDGMEEEGEGMDVDG
jgi:DNA-directed RNA polymerase III subunit RPC8